MEHVSLRNLRQQEFSEQWINSNRRSILYLAPRFGKIFVAINILEKLSPDTILIAYPDNKIKASWKEDFIKRGYDDCNVVYTTHLSLHKWVDKFDLIILDECHLLSESQIDVCKRLFLKNNQILGLTGTLSEETENMLYKELNFPVLAEYTIEKAIKEGIITDYEINIVKVPLDDKLRAYKDKTEKRKFDSISWVIDKWERDGKDTKFLRLARMRIIQNSISKLQKTRELILSNFHKRILVFCGITKTADSLGIASFHSKSKDKEIFQNFVNGQIKHLAVCRIGNTGVTYTPLNMVIINYFDSNSQNLTQRLNRCMSMEYDNPEKKAKIYIISSTEKVEENWLSKALSMFSPEKIKYL
jgi:superfamily II DNA or RNA helicase